MLRQSFTYADIGLVPREASEIATRSSVKILDKFLEYPDPVLPILAAPMKTVVGHSMARELSTHGMIPILPRTTNLKYDINLYSSSDPNSIVSVGVDGDYMERVEQFISAGASRFCIDVANGFHYKVRNLATKIRELETTSFKPVVIAGNVASKEGYFYLRDICQGVRIGIGGGAACTTSINTGIGRGTGDLLLEINEANKLIATKGALVIADGGIRDYGDILKALVLGADMVMIGSMFAGTDEAPGEIISIDGVPHKVFAGEASSYSKGHNKHEEGIQTVVPCKGSISGIIRKIMENLQSGMAYLNCSTLEDIKELDIERTVVLLSSNARHERHPIR